MLKRKKKNNIHEPIKIRYDKDCVESDLKDRVCLTWSVSLQTLELDLPLPLATLDADEHGGVATVENTLH